MVWLCLTSLLTSGCVRCTTGTQQLGGVVGTLWRSGLDMGHAAAAATWLTSESVVVPADGPVTSDSVVLGVMGCMS
jgi:hypothetical protein